MSAQSTRGPVRSRWSFRVGSIAGIPIRIHATLGLLLFWIALSYSLRGVGPTGTIGGLILVVCVFAIIVLHELTHALVAKRFGVRTRDILLLPIGGIASLERIPERPAQELAVSVAGPAVNLVLAGLLWIGIAVGGGSVALDAPRSLGWALVVQLFWINIALAVFNLLPAFPLDGGRALRAFLALWMPRARATAIAAGLGKVFAVAFGIFGLLYNPILAIIALVIWFGARTEGELTRLRSLLAGVPAREAMRRRIDSLPPEAPLEAAARLIVDTGSEVVPIVEHGAALGVLTRSDIAAGIDESGPDAPVAAAPRHEAVAVDPEDSLDQVFDRLHAAPDGVAIVLDHGTPVGVVTPDQLATYAAMRARSVGRL